MIIFTYLLTVMFTGVPAILRGEFWLGLAGLIAPCLALIAGGGIKESLKVPNYPVVGATALGTFLFALSAYWINAAGWSIRIERLILPGVAVCSIGFLIGLLFYKSSQNSQAMSKEVDSPDDNFNDASKKMKVLRHGLRVFSGLSWIIFGLYFIFFKYNFSLISILFPIYFIIGTGFVALIFGEIQYIFQRVLVGVCKIVSEYPSSLGGKIISLLSLLLISIVTFIIFLTSYFFLQLIL